MLRALVVSLVAGFGAAPLLAQETGPALVGRVVDEQGAALAQALVEVEGTGRMAETDSTGRFVLRHLTPGRQHLRVSLLGYTPASRHIEVPATGQSVTLDFTLVSTPLALPGLQVTGTISGRDPLALTQSTVQLSGKQLERELGATLAETLRHQPGLAVRYNGPAAAAPVIRGLTGDRVLVLQDGQRTADLSGSADDHGVTIDPLLAQRIEVVRGPATLLYGNNALGGVVNLISGDLPTTLPSHSSFLLGLQSESAYPGVAGALKATLPLGGRWVLAARGGGKTAGDTRIGRDPDLGRRLENTAQRNLNGAAGLGYIGDRLVASSALRLYGFRYGLPVPPETDPVGIRGHRHEAAGRAEWSLPSPALPSLRFEGTSQDYLHEEFDVASGTALQTFALRTQTLNLTLRQGRLGPLAEGAWGISGLFKDYTATGPAALTPAADSRALGIFGFQELALTEGGAALQLGGRYDGYRIASRADEKFGAAHATDFRALSGSLGLRIPLTAGISFGTSYARSFRAPTVEELFSGAYHAGTGTVEYGDPDLREERGRGFEGVLRVQTGRLHGQLAAYHNTIDHYIYQAARGDTVIDGTTVTILTYTQDRATLYGGEGSLEWAAGRRLVLTLIGDIVRATLRDGTPLSYIPPARLGAELHWDDGALSLGGGLHRAFRQDRIGPADELPTPTHTNFRLSAGIRKQVGGMTHSLSLRGDNLGNSLHREATSRIKDFAPNPGRNLALSYRVYF